MSRREFLKLGGAGLAGTVLLGAAGCGGPSASGALTVASWDVASDALRSTISLFKKKRPGTDVSMQSARHHVEYMRGFYGPFHKTFETLDEEGQKALEEDLVSVVEGYNVSGGGTAVWPAGYLEVVVTRS